MKKSLRLLSLLVLLAPFAGRAQETYPAAIFTFQERGRGVTGYGAKVADLLFATLATDERLMLVDREELDKVLAEQELNLSGLANPGQAVQVGQLIGARILISGSVIESDDNLMIVAKLIGTETSRVLGESVKGKAGEDLLALVEGLSAKISAKIAADADKIVAKAPPQEDLAAAINAQLGERKRPTLSVRIPEAHIGQATIDPAAETEVSVLAKASGFELIDAKEAGKADVRIEGEAFSELAMRRGNLVSVKARVEIKAIDRASGKVLHVDRQTAVVVDVAEHIAGKTALQKAAAQIAARMLPKLGVE